MRCGVRVTVAPASRAERQAATAAGRTAEAAFAVLALESEPVAS